VKRRPKRAQPIHCEHTGGPRAARRLFDALAGRGRTRLRPGGHHARPAYGGLAGAPGGSGRTGYRGARARELARRAHRAFDQGNLRASLSLFQRAAEQDPDSVEIQSNLGSLHFRLEEYRSAEAAYRRALAIDADDYFAHFYLGITHHRLGETTRARHHFQRALEIRPDSREARAWLERVRPGTSNGSPSS